MSDDKDETRLTEDGTVETNYDEGTSFKGRPFSRA